MQRRTDIPHPRGGNYAAVEVNDREEVTELLKTFAFYMDQPIQESDVPPVQNNFNSGWNTEFGGKMSDNMTHDNRTGFL